ncbi:MAG: hypothetical protein JHC81_09720 [Brevundimonas sp.]|uniref:hypothetical protein n=1 Tax=Brevundimonas sp. TaxID=1871086 RepID=UPI001A27AD2A|nr:hypothetical protein [Brevundimonas sp.]MBJ7447800.1 hypothetical protein [Brevundimonas sp.]
MIRILAVLAASLGFGGLLAWTWASWPVAPGWIGAGVLIVSAALIRRYWDRRRNDAGDEPGPYERLAWHTMVSMAVLASHLMASLATGLDLHVGQGNTLATDNWTLILAAAIGWLLMRPRSMQRDERDKEMASRGAHAGFRTLIGLLIILLSTLGFAPIGVTETLTPFVIGNLLVVVILIGVLAGCLAQLIGYWNAARPERIDG